MDPAAISELQRLRMDYKEVTGSSWTHFYCPLLFRDEAVDLCKAHIVNKAFPASSRVWTIQRADVDNFYGAMFEAEFLDVLYKEGRWSPLECLAEPDLAKRFRPRLDLGGETIHHFRAQDAIPDRFMQGILKGSGYDIRLGLKIDPDEFWDRGADELQIIVEKDLSVPVLASVLKAAHLTMFKVLGYRYGLSAGGHFTGYNILGAFFLKHRCSTREEVRRDAREHFLQFVNMIRPVTTHSPNISGTVDDSVMYLVPAGGGRYWAAVVFVRTSQLLHAALLPICETPDQVQVFLDFLRDDRPRFPAYCCRLDSGTLNVSKDARWIDWNRAGLGDPN